MAKSHHHPEITGMPYRGGLWLKHVLKPITASVMGVEGFTNQRSKFLLPFCFECGVRRSRAAQNDNMYLRNKPHGSWLMVRMACKDSHRQHTSGAYKRISLVAGTI